MLLLQIPQGEDRVVVCPKSLLPAGLDSLSADAHCLGPCLVVKEILKIRYVGEKQSLCGSEHADCVCQPSCCQGWEEMLSREFRSSSLPSFCHGQAALCALQGEDPPPSLVRQDQIA